jgi:hypothetical protein
MKIELGRADKDRKISMDVDVMLTTRLLVTADSGGGKTVLLKRLCEQMSGHIPVIVIDPEGEFAPLREKFDFVLVGPGGEIPADPRSASLVAQTLLKLRTSAICDIYEMPESVRHQFVKNFCDGLINSPKNLWHPTVIVVDEAHMFCPEKGTGESIASDSVKALSTRGRKRGICPIFATQRLSEFNKGASSMCLNRLVGGTFEDVNLVRAAQVLSIPPSDKHKFYDEIKLLEPGYFFGLGRAICKERELIHIGPIVTAHGKAAQKYAVVPPPPLEEIAKLIPKLAELPKTAEEKAQTEAELRKEIRELKVQVRTAAKAAPVATPPVSVTKAVDINRAVSRATTPLVKMLEDAMKIIVRVEAFGTLAHLKDEELTRLLDTVKREVKKLAEDKLNSREKEIAMLQRDVKATSAKIKELLEAHGKEAGKRIEISVTAASPKIPAVEIQRGGGSRVAEAPTHRSVTTSQRGGTERPSTQQPETNGNLPKTHSRVLAALREFQAIGVNKVGRPMLASWLGLRVTGTFKNYLSELRQSGYIADTVNELLFKQGECDVIFSDATTRESGQFMKASGYTLDPHTGWWVLTKKGRP